MAGSINSAQLFCPNFLCAYSKPRTLPGTPEDRHPTMLSRVGLPLASRYMLRVAAPGAFSRKSMKAVRPSAMRMSMKPPPPILPAKGYVTAKVKPTATAASTALPPALRTATPTSVACGSCVTTITWRARTGSRAQRTAHTPPVARSARIFIKTECSAGGGRPSERLYWRWPPATISVWPVTQPESSDAKNTAVLPMSSGCAMRPSGVTDSVFL